MGLFEQFNAVCIVLFFTFLCKRNRECIKYKNCVCFHCLSPYSKDSREMQGEQILRGLQCLFWPARAKLIIFAADIPCFKPLPPPPPPTVLRSPILNAGRTLLPVCALFTFLYLFRFVHLFFLLPFVPSLFFIVLFLYSHFYAHFFHRPQLYSSTRFIRRDYLLVCFSFHSSQSSRNVGLLSTHVPPYPPPPPRSTCYHAWFVHIMMVSLWKNGARILRLNLANHKSWTLQTLRTQHCEHLCHFLIRTQHGTEYCLSYQRACLLTHA